MNLTKAKLEALRESVKLLQEYKIAHGAFEVSLIASLLDDVEALRAKRRKAKPELYRAPHRSQTHERFTTGTGQHILVHLQGPSCVKYGCVIHAPSKHIMDNWPTNWRPDRLMMERVCSHGIGHPDPDDIAYKVRAMGKREGEGYAVHGCDGCCVEA